MTTPAHTEISEQLLGTERAKAELRLAGVRVVLLAVVSIVQLVFALAAARSDLHVQVRAVLLFASGAGIGGIWWWVLLRFGVFRRAAYVSTTLDVVLASAIVLGWSIYPGAGILPTQLQFGAGFGILLAVLVLTAARFDARMVLLATLEVVAFYVGLAVLVASSGTAHFVAAVSESRLPDTINSSDFAGRLAILVLTGLLLAYLGWRVERLLRRSIRITEQKQRLGQFVSTNVVEALESGEAGLDLSGQRRRIAILFCDIRGFTNLSETLEPEMLLSVLNEYYELAAEEVFRHQGTLDKYLGDGFMALFGAPTPLDNPSEAALACGLSLLEKVRAFRPSAVDAISIGVGIHTDDVVVGNLGTDAYKSYTAIGRGVNMAARIEAATRQSEASLLFSREVRESLDGRFEVTEVGTFELKGIAKPQVLFTASEKG